MVYAFIGSIAFFLIVVLYVLLIFGFPYGEFAMGGKYKTVPKDKRLIYVISIIVQIFAIAILLQTGGIVPFVFSKSVTKWICIFFAAYLTINVLANIMSKSKKEKYVMTPISLIIAICFWITALSA